MLWPLLETHVWTHFFYLPHFNEFSGISGVVTHWRFRLSNKLIIDKYCFVFIVSLGSVYFSIYSGFLLIHPHLLAFLLFIYSLYPRLHLLLTTNAWSFTSITRFQCRNTAIVVFLVLLGLSEESCIFRNKYYILLVLLIVCVNRLRFCS